MTLHLPDIPAATRMTEAELRLELACALYAQGKVTKVSGAAAELAGVPKPVFLERLAAYGVPAFRQSRAELSEEAANA